MDRTREPLEPIVALDEQLEEEVLADPIAAAIETVAQAAEHDPVVDYFCKEGRAKDCCAHVLRALRTEHTYEIHELQQFACTAWVLDTADEAEAGREHAERWPDPQALAEGSLDRLLAQGLSRAMAEAALLARPERVAWLQGLVEELDRRRRQFIQEHGPILHLTFLGCRQPVSALPSDMLQHLSRVADVQRKWIYVEATSQDSIELYRRQGFRKLGSVQVGGEEGREVGAPAVAVMARPPAERGH